MINNDFTEKTFLPARDLNWELWLIRGKRRRKQENFKVDLILQESFRAKNSFKLLLFYNLRNLQVLLDII